MPALLKMLYRIATPTPRIPSEKKPGTIFNTVAPHEDAVARFPPATVALRTSLEIGPTKVTPTRMDMNPPIKSCIILCLLEISLISRLFKPLPQNLHVGFLGV